ncbi:unnamed protein product [Menidia menidia]|uniref:DNA polymerase delta subunit 3 n=1 Tax=Menidia menidia TaxID=238744 RepID=A0A8S4AUS9_9TELE|nr:unnamed protein product [Menidia menidia]
MDELYLDNIDEYVNDHDKIVTYKWLSLTLGVHVNIAKQMLYHYLEHKRKESSPQLHATYLVSGKLVENGQTCHKVSVVREDQLEDFKAKMSPVVSVHVYSVQKALLKDSNPLYIVDYDAVKDNLKSCSRFSAIRCPAAVPLSSAQPQQGRETPGNPPPEPETRKTGMNGHANVAPKPPAKPQKGIMGMFSSKPASKNQDGGKEIKSEVKEHPPSEDVPKSKPVAKVNPMLNFFGNQTTKKPDKPVKQEEAAERTSTPELQPPSSPTEEKEKPKGEPEPPPKDSRSKSKRIEDSGSEEEKMEKKKRRRIKRPEPDSSDEDDSPQQTETRQPTLTKEPDTVQQSQVNEPREQQTPFPREGWFTRVSDFQGNSGTKMRKRRRVLKSRTFVDEEGCIVTEKCYESESYSETEEDFQPSKQPPRDPVRAKPSAGSKGDDKKNQKKASASSNKGTKQASIMGFFQKK